MRIRYNLTTDDIIALYKYHYRNSPDIKRQRRFYGIFAGGILLLIFSYFAITERSFRPFIDGAVFASVALVFATIISRYNLKREIKKQYGGGSIKGAVGEHAFELTDTDVIDKTDVRETRYRISSLERIEITSEYGFIYTGSSEAHVIPRKNILEGDFDIFFQELKKRCGQA